jgi:hypothetical protein
VGALDERHRDRQAELSGRLARALGTVVASWETLSEDELRAYHDRAYPLVAGGQRQAGRLAAAYGLTLTRRPGVPPTPTDVTGALRSSGVAITPEARSLVAPPLRARALVADGATLIEAKAEAAEYAGQLGSLDLQAAQRVGLEQGVGAGGARIVGYRKELTGGACEWCRETAATTYRTADAVPFHRNDGCSVAPVLADSRERGGGEHG